MATNMLGFAGLGLTAFALLCAIIACALPYWKSADTSAQETSSGLWRYCVKIPAANLDYCGAIDYDTLDSEGERRLHAIRAMVIISMICLTGSCVALGLLLFVMKDKPILGYVSGGVSIAGGLFMMIGMAIYVEDELATDEEYGAGLAFCIISWVIALAAGAVAIVSVLKQDSNTAVESKS